MSSSRSVSWYRLILHPADATAPVPDAAGLRATVASLGLLGAPFEFQGEQYFEPGEEFLDLVVFLGCSPVIELQRQDGSDGMPRMDRFCHVRLPPATDAAQLQLGDPAAAPRCPKCRTAIADWREWLTRWRAEPLQPSWRCPACQHAASAADIQWRQAGAVLRTRIELGGVHPYEAVPSESLLSGLERATAQPWKYFYARP